MDRFEGRFGVVKNDSRKANPNSSQKTRWDLYIDSRKETRGKVTQGEGWENHSRKSSLSRTKSTIMIIVKLFDSVQKQSLVPRLSEPRVWEL